MMCDMPPNSLRDPQVGPRVKQQQNKKIETHSLTCIIFGVGRHVEAPGWD
jgi:hypothetical protein